MSKRFMLKPTTFLRIGRTSTYRATATRGASRLNTAGTRSQAAGRSAEPAERAKPTERAERAERAGLFQPVLRQSGQRQPGLRHQDAARSQFVRALAAEPRAG